MTYSVIGLIDDVLLNVVDGKPIRTNTIDRLPPWRAYLVARVAVLAGAELEHGDIEAIRRAAKAAGGAAEPGWWRAALGMEPVDHDYVPPAPGPAVPPPGWRIVHDPHA